MKYLVVLIVLGAIGCGGRSAKAPAEMTKPSNNNTIESLPRSVMTTAEITSILERSCLECHDADSSRGGIALDADPAEIDCVTWGRVADALRSRAMPPRGRPKLSRNEREGIEDWIDANIFSCTLADRDPGEVRLRRLNRAEYDRTIQDLFGFDRDPNLSAAFPADDVGEGFDRIGEVLAIPPILVEKYLVAADRASEAALHNPVVWSRLANPPPDTIPLRFRKPTFAVRGEPIKRIGRPEAVVPIVEDPGAIRLRRAQDILRAFADRAFRRPATQAELTRLVGLFESAIKEGDDFDRAMQFALKAVLISPHFLFLVEDGPELVDATRPRPIDEFALASRLSYFLTSGPPDEELYRLAIRGELRQGENLAKQARRLLQGNKSRALVDGFVAQWLQIRALKDVTPDPVRFPDFDESLRRDMTEETCQFAVALIQEDRSVIEFLTADFTFLNERLARHYGINGVVGPDFRRVSLTGTNRGGILTHASFLTVTSNPTRTSPVKRGKWVLETILGLTTLPPPQGVEGLIAEHESGPSTTRQQLERHRRDPACASCHDRMDPIGFGLENFDATGAWRDFEGGTAIDASGNLPGGEPLEGPVALREALKSRSDAFVRCLAEKMLIYSLGRGLRPGDRCFVDAIVRKTQRDDNRFSSLVTAIVESPPFQNRSSLGPKE